MKGSSGIKGNKGLREERGNGVARRWGGAQLGGAGRGQAGAGPGKDYPPH